MPHFSPFRSCSPWSFHSFVRRELDGLEKRWKKLQVFLWLHLYSIANSMEMLTSFTLEPFQGQQKVQQQCQLSINSVRFFFLFVFFLIDVKTGINSSCWLCLHFVQPGWFFFSPRERGCQFTKHLSVAFILLDVKNKIKQLFHVSRNISSLLLIQNWTNLHKKHTKNTRLCLCLCLRCGRGLRMLNHLAGLLACPPSHDAHSLRPADVSCSEFFNLWRAVIHPHGVWPANWRRRKKTSQVCWQ